MIVLEDEPEQFVICCFDESDHIVLEDTDGCAHCGGGKPSGVVYRWLM